MQSTKPENRDMWSQVLRFNLVGFGVPLAALAIVLVYSHYSGIHFRDKDFKQLAGLLWLAGIFALVGVFLKVVLVRPRRNVTYLQSVQKARSDFPEDA